MRTQHLVAWAPLCFTLLIWPGPGTPAMYVAFAFMLVFSGVVVWRLGVSLKRRHRVDSMIRRRMWHRFLAGKGLPRIHRD